MTGDGLLRWRDGAEDRLESILREAADRSTASDDLASRISDWPTRYHLDRRRTNLLRPLRLCSLLFLGTFLHHSSLDFCAEHFCN